MLIHSNRSYAQVGDFDRNCCYCGANGHRAIDCPVLSEAEKKELKDKWKENFNRFKGRRTGQAHVNTEV